MPLVYSEDGKLLFAIDDHNDVQDGIPQSAVYDARNMNVLFARHGSGVDGGAPPNIPGVPIVAPPSVPPVGSTAGARGVLKVTDASDGEFVNRGYSYWPSIWINEGANAFLLFAGHVDGNARFFQVDRSSFAITRVGTPFTLQRYIGTTEGWYFDADGWIYLCDGPWLRRVNPMGSDGEDHIVLDISDTHPGCDLWQAHSSDDGQVHSATVRRIVPDGAYPAIGTVVLHHGVQRYYEARDALDESQVTSDGAFLIIKEGNYNRIIDLNVSKAQQIITDAEGAVGHSDCGPSIIVGEDDQHGECVLWDLQTMMRRTLFSTWNMGHVSVRGGRCLLSGPQALSLVPLFGGQLEHLVDHGMVGDGSYDTQVFATLDPTGRVAAFLTNNGTKDNRLDVSLLEL